MAFVRCSGGVPAVNVITDSIAVPPSAITSKILYTATKNKAVNATITIAFSASTSISSATFSDSYLTIGNTNYPIYNNLLPFTNPVSVLTCVINANIAAGESITIGWHNKSAAITQTLDIAIALS